MKRLAVAAAIVVAAFSAAMADEEVKMLEKETTTVSVPFGIKSYTPSNKEVVRVEMTSETSLRLTALKKGRCDIDVRGDMDTAQKFFVEVGDPAARTLANLRRELERMPEVHAEIVGDSIRVDGVVRSFAKWNYLRKVLLSKQYADVRSFVEFRPTVDQLAKMNSSLRQFGFEVVSTPFTGDSKSWKGNCVALAYNEAANTMTVQARVYTPKQKETIEQCVRRERAWIAIEGEKPGDSKSELEEEFKVRLNMQVEVAKPTIRLSVAYMAIGEEEAVRLGNQQANKGEGALQLTGIFDVLRDLVHGQNTRNTASIGASLGVATRFLAQSGITRKSDVGYTLIESWSPEGAKFKSGGTRFVKVYGRDIAELKEIPYGFTIDAKGGMVDDKTMDIDFDFGLSTIVPMDDETYDRKEDLSKQKILCPIGRTTLVSGFMDLVDKKTPPSGIPFVRSTPLLNWFVADSGKEVSDRRLVIMVCPEIVDSTQEEKPDVDREINIRVQDQASKTTDQVVEEREAGKAFTGFWSWLNWFTF